MKATGFIDLHTHGAGGFDTRTKDPGHILNIAELHGMAGTGAILPTIYPAPIKEIRNNIKAVKTAIEIQRAAGGGEKTHSSPSLPGRRREINGESCVTHRAALILGVHLEGPFLNRARCGALDGESFLQPSISALDRILDGYEDIVRIIVIAPEIPGALEVIEKCARSGIRVNMGHSNATYEEATEGKKAGARGITHIFNAMRPFHHREPGIAGLGLVDEDLYIEVIADGVHLHPGTLALLFYRKRLDRIILVSDSVRSGQQKSVPLCKAKGILAGSGITISDSAAVLRHAGIPHAAFIEAAIDNPLRYLQNDASSL